MNPFSINRIIKKSKSEGKDISTNDLSKLCDCRISHAFVKTSKDVFISDTGRPHHKVTGLRFGAWFHLWFYNPPKFSETHKELTPMNELQNIGEYLAQQKSDNINMLGE